MKKMIILSGALYMLASQSANAQISVAIGVPVYAEPGYVAMAPDYPSEHYDIHRHRHNDYWARQPRQGRGHR